jgi:cold shock protein
MCVASPSSARFKISGEYMASGKVKWFDNKRGFGFIAQESGQDVFVHHTSIVGRGFKTLNEGDEVTFDVIPGERGLKAQNVQRPEAS